MKLRMLNVKHVLLTFHWKKLNCITQPPFIKYTSVKIKMYCHGHGSPCQVVPEDKMPDTIISPGFDFHTMVLVPESQAAALIKCLPFPNG